MSAHIEDQERDAFFIELTQDILAAIEADDAGGHREEVFTQKVIELLADAGETEDARECLDIKEDSIGRKVHKINGYAFNEPYETIDLFITIFRGGDIIEKIGKDEVLGAANQAKRFLNSAVKKHYIGDLEESSRIFDLASTVTFNKKNIIRCNIYILSNGLVSADAPQGEDLESISISYHIRDIDYIFKLNASEIKRIPIEIAFDNTLFGSPIPCLAVPSDNDDYEAYLCVIPGDTLANIYQTYGARLLEQNVRSFLQFSGKINKKIKDTVKNEPHMFLAYNNGIAATAGEVKVEQTENGKFLTAVHDLQIVNGGQTTATIFYSQRDKINVSNIFVQMKLSIIKNKNNTTQIVSNISRFANSQNKVSEADLSSNNPFHISLEKLSRYIYTPATSGGSVQTRWFYERARGQYKNASLAERTPKRKKEFEVKNPKNQMFSKEDLAKFYNSWNEKAWMVVRGNQKNYADFMKNIEKVKLEEADEAWFKDLIAMAILFRSADKIYGVRPNSIGDMKYITVPYALSWLNKHTEGKMDLSKVWKNQKAPECFSELLYSLMSQIEQRIKQKATGGLYGEFAKKQDCWDIIAEAKFNIDLSLLKNDFISNNQARSSRSVKELEQESNINHIKEFSVLHWRKIWQWGSDEGTFTEYQRKEVYDLYKAIENNRNLKESQIKCGLQAIEIAWERNPGLLADIETSQADDTIPTISVDLDLIRKLIEWDKKHKVLWIPDFTFLKNLADGSVILNAKYHNTRVLKCFTVASKRGFTI